MPFNTDYPSLSRSEWIQRYSATGLYEAALVKARIQRYGPPPWGQKKENSGQPWSYGVGPPSDRKRLDENASDTDMPHALRVMIWECPNDTMQEMGICPWCGIHYLPSLPELTRSGRVNLHRCRLRTHLRREHRVPQYRPLPLANRTRQTSGFPDEPFVVLSCSFCSRRND